MPASPYSPFLKIEAAGEATPGRIFARFADSEITLGALAADSLEIARSLAASGLRPGDRVAVMMANRPLVLALIFAIARAGLVWVPVNTRQQGLSLGHILRHSAPSLLLVDEDLHAAVAGCGSLPPALRVVPVLMSDERPALRAVAEPRLPATIAEEALFAIMYTSGTTGSPKGVEVTHRMFGYAARAVALVGGMQDGDVLFVWEPLYHIGGSQLLLLPLMLDVHLHMVPRFSASRFWSEAREGGATHIHFLGGILEILLRQPAHALDREHSVRIAWGGGCRRDDWEEFERRFGVDVRECYGMTEASSMSTVNIDGPVGSVGKPVPWLDVEVLDPDGRSVAPFQRGEIVVSEREPGALFGGYLDDPETTAKALRGGKLFTGDAGSFDANGYLSFHGRQNDSVRHRGENISAWEVESVALQHPSVAEVAMIGVAAEIGEQDIKLFVALREGAAVAAPDLAEWLDERLGRARAPRYIAFVDEFPKTPSERIRKGLLPADTAGCWDREAADMRRLMAG